MPIQCFITKGYIHVAMHALSCLCMLYGSLMTVNTWEQNVTFGCIDPVLLHAICHTVSRGVFWGARAPHSDPAGVLFQRTRVKPCTSQK